MDELIRQYAEHLRSERNVSPHTLRNYLSDLAQFEQFLIEKELCLGGGKTIDVRKVDIYIVRAYLAALTKDRKKSSIGRKLAALKGFRYLVTAGQIERPALAHSLRNRKSRCRRFSRWTMRFTCSMGLRSGRVGYS
jgi:integrase/recombinase XerC